MAERRSWVRKEWEETVNDFLFIKHTHRIPINLNAKPGKEWASDQTIERWNSPLIRQIPLYQVNQTTTRGSEDKIIRQSGDLSLWSITLLVIRDQLLRDETNGPVVLVVAIINTWLISVAKQGDLQSDIFEPE